jgi:hypothetical protein
MTLVIVGGTTEPQLEEGAHVERRSAQVDAQPLALPGEDAVLRPGRDAHRPRPPLAECEPHAPGVRDDRLEVAADHLDVRVPADQDRDGEILVDHGLQLLHPAASLSGEVGTFDSSGRLVFRNRTSSLVAIINTMPEQTS